MRFFLLRLCAIFWAASCAIEAYADAPVVTPAPVRFILTFDDGPDGREKDNPTASILATLAENPTQKDIKAIFFVQTRSSEGGATACGQALLGREHAQGHVLALHDGSTLGHPNHCKLSDAVLEQSLNDGLADLMTIAGRPTTLLRPPYWAYNERTLATYARHGLAVLLTDISANDGKVWGYHGSPRRRSHMASEMAHVKERMQRSEIPGADGATPIVVTFHDTNDYTAEHMQEYLHMLVDEARRAGLTLAARPFYDDGATLERAALIRAHDVAHRADMVPAQWRWLYWLFG
ncbi:Polysaccharide deacetylase [Georgfuchsia toluolica]|uniref:Polysaccharide deacetylase n=1 Tax=Georgfuchsia toluolica TaxID=424218 RepID=A0A916J6S7_9PROT|nr:polysaccharide deacetylase family protein [Georgfuchsia toluolica]CAG4883461.1 Polysaccharide deacetylase [Georgfuchsia toluolica]